MTGHEFVEQFENRTSYNHNDLFRPGSISDLNACVGNNGGPYDFQDYSIGYFDSGERLYKSIESNRYCLDVLVYPLVYLYRHAIELGLKHLVKILPQLFEETDSIQYTHNLKDNWEVVKNYLLRVFENYGSYFEDGDSSIKDTIAFVEKVLDDIIEIDSNGQSFRFPILRNGDFSLKEISHINVKVFHDTMLEIKRCFEYWFNLLEIIWDDYQEYRYYLE